MWLGLRADPRQPAVGCCACVRRRVAQLRDLVGKLSQTDVASLLRQPGLGGSAGSSPADFGLL